MRQQWEAFSNWEELKEFRKRNMLLRNRKTGDDDSCLPCGAEFFNVPEGDSATKHGTRPNYRAKNNVSLFEGVAEMFLEPKSICRLCSSMFFKKSRANTEDSRELHRMLRDGDLKGVRERMDRARQQGEKSRKART